MTQGALGAAEREEGRWEALAYATRYGHQQLPDLEQRTTRYVMRYVEALDALIAKETPERRIHESGARGGG
jgi:hypothetical protein